jgi:dethiobiotin synthetase
MPCGIFITGTDTGVGKTVVAAGLVRLGARMGTQTVGLKPIASGAMPTPGGLRNDDALALAAAGSLRLPYADTNPLCFEPAIAPHLAAAEAGATITVPTLLDWYGRVTGDAGLVIVEGAGGWRVPLHPEGFLSDLPEQLGLGVVLVVGLRLGCLNHARLTREAIERSGRSAFLGWIGSHIDPGFERAAANLGTLERLLGGPALAVLPMLPDTSPDRVADLLDTPAVRRLVAGTS